MNKKLPNKLYFKNTLYLLSENYQEDTNKLSGMLTKENIKVVIKSHSSIFERVPKHNTITNKKNDQLIAIIFDIDDYCYSYHTYKNIQIASRNYATFLFLYVFIWVDIIFILIKKINCWCYELLRILKYNTLINTRFFNKFTSNCIGKQTGKNRHYEKNGIKENWKYRPEDKYKHKKTNKKKPQNKKKTHKKTQKKTH